MQRLLTIEFTQILKPTNILNSGCYTGSAVFSSIIFFLGKKKTRKHKWELIPINYLERGKNQMEMTNGIDPWIYS